MGFIPTVCHCLFVCCFVTPSSPRRGKFELPSLVHGGAELGRVGRSGITALIDGHGLGGLGLCAPSLILTSFVLESPLLVFIKLGVLVGFYQTRSPSWSPSFYQTRSPSPSFFFIKLGVLVGSYQTRSPSCFFSNYES